MNFGLHLAQSQTQKLVLTTQMQQSIQVLSYSAEELEAYLYKLSQENPLIEWDSIKISPLKQVRLSKHLNGDSDGSTSAIQRAAYQPTRTERLSHQIRMMGAPPETEQVALFLVGLLDNLGYIRETADEICRICRTTPYQLQSAFDLLHELEPTGIGARSLEECLLLQLPQVPQDLRPLVRRIIENHLSDLAESRMSKIAKACAVDLSVVQDATTHILRLNPRPGLLVSDDTPEFVVPEVSVRKNGQGYVLKLLREKSPKLHVHGEYLRMLENANCEETQAYIAKKNAEIKQLQQDLQQRRTTVMKVAEAIIERQQAFFDVGPLALKPMSLRDLAEQLNLHESTISRAVRGKYMDTPRGIFEFKYFLSSALGSDKEGGTASASAAKAWIVQLVEREDPLHPLSDEAIVTALADEGGIRLSRRTVAKYREELRIGSSAKRRQYAKRETR